ncbi:methionyl-tRNA formyltransferase [Propionibacteriaceae bacterium Y1700]|uniref:methionyl-tRNA formyltransferase n=1 Tax=Microlunatus sp. Y1700 TaxID=3418487 RepID=UPI003DA75BDE
MRLVFAGTPEVAVMSLNALVESAHEVVAVVTRPDAPSGRGRSLRPSPVAARAQELGLETLKPAKPSDPDFVARLTELAPDCCPVVAYGALVPQKVLDIPTHGWVNLHFSLLPRWRGAAPVQHAVMAGDPETGAVTFQLVKAMDAGPVYGSITTPIEPDTTSGDLLDQLAVDGAQLLVETIDQLGGGTATAVPQPEQGITVAPKITTDDARLDWNRTAVELDRQVRGCHPAPGAWALFRGERFKINSARPIEGAAPVGQLEITKKTVAVGTGQGLLELDNIQPPGKKAMRAADWARGVQFTEGEALS